jgi:hypothetical protein
VLLDRASEACVLSGFDYDYEAFCIGRPHLELAHYQGVLASIWRLYHYIKVPKENRNSKDSKETVRKIDSKYWIDVRTHTRIYGAH